MGFFECCNGCDSRFPGCHSQCEKYLESKTKYDERKAIDRKQRDTRQGLRDQRTEAVGKAVRRWRRWK